MRVGKLARKTRKTRSDDAQIRGKRGGANLDGCGSKGYFSNGSQEQPISPLSNWQMEQNNWSSKKLLFPNKTNGTNNSSSQKAAPQSQKMELQLPRLCATGSASPAGLRPAFFGEACLAKRPSGQSTASHACSIISGALQAHASYCMCVYNIVYLHIYIYIHMVSCIITACITSCGAG